MMEQHVPEAVRRVTDYIVNFMGEDGDDDLDHPANIVEVVRGALGLDGGRLYGITLASRLAHAGRTRTVRGFVFGPNGADIDALYRSYHAELAIPASRSELLTRAGCPREERENPWAVAEHWVVAADAELRRVTQQVLGRLRGLGIDISTYTDQTPLDALFVLWLSAQPGWAAIDPADLSLHSLSGEALE